MRFPEVLSSIDQVMSAVEERFDYLAVKADLDPERDFIGMDLRTARFSGADLSSYNFALCDTRGTDLELAKNAPRNLHLAITDKTERSLGAEQLEKFKELVNEYLGEKTATRRLVAFIGFVNSNVDIQLLAFTAEGLRLAVQTRLEHRILGEAIELVSRGRRYLTSNPGTSRQLNPMERDQIVQVLSKAMVSGGYPYRRAEVALELSRLLPVAKGVEVYLRDLASRSNSGSSAMEEVRARIARLSQ